MFLIYLKYLNQHIFKIIYSLILELLLIFEIWLPITNMFYIIQMGFKQVIILLVILFQDSIFFLKK